MMWRASCAHSVAAGLTRKTQGLTTKTPSLTRKTQGLTRKTMVNNCRSRGGTRRVHKAESLRQAVGRPPVPFGRL